MIELLSISVFDYLKIFGEYVFYIFDLNSIIHTDLSLKLQVIDLN